LEKNMKRTLFIGALALALPALALAQTNERGDATKDLTNCPPASAATSGAASSDAASTDAKAVEKSAILPSAENHENSAAPTVQRDGQSVEARADCPQDADQPKPKG
jgi:hypothetical protein